MLEYAFDDDAIANGSWSLERREVSGLPPPVHRRPCRGAFQPEYPATA